MIRHIVFFTAKDRSDTTAILEGLSLLRTIPHVRRLEVAENLRIDQIENEIDMVLYAEFESEAQLGEYKTHPTYAEATRRVRPLREHRFAVDIFAGDNAV